MYRQVGGGPEGLTGWPLNKPTGSPWDRCKITSRFEQRNSNRRTPRTRRIPCEVPVRPWRSSVQAQIGKWFRTSSLPARRDSKAANQKSFASADSCVPLSPFSPKKDADWLNVQRLIIGWKNPARHSRNQWEAISGQPSTRKPYPTKRPLHPEGVELLVAVVCYVVVIHHQLWNALRARKSSPSRHPGDRPYFAAVSVGGNGWPNLATSWPFLPFQTRTTPSSPAETTIDSSPEA